MRGSTCWKRFGKGRVCWHLLLIVVMAMVVLLGGCSQGAGDIGSRMPAADAGPDVTPDVVPLLPPDVPEEAHVALLDASSPGVRDSGLVPVPPSDAPMPPPPENGRCATLPGGHRVCLATTPLGPTFVDPGMTSLPTDNLPARVSHRETYLARCAPAARDQEGCGWCTEHAVAHALEAFGCEAGDSYEALSVSHLRRNSLVPPWCDVGNSVTLVLAGARLSRIVPESTWPYAPPAGGTGTVGGAPTAAVLESDGRVLVTDWGFVPAGSVTALKAAVAAGYNPVIGVPVTWALGWQQGSERYENGFIRYRPPAADTRRCQPSDSSDMLGDCRCDIALDCPNPFPGGLNCINNRCADGFHAIVITGYDDRLGTFEFRNSWGSGWGELGGWGHLGYSWVAAMSQGGMYASRVDRRRHPTPDAGVPDASTPRDASLVDVVGPPDIPQLPDTSPPPDTAPPRCPEGTPCDDRNPCTTEDRCDRMGACTGTPVVCTFPPSPSCVSTTLSRRYTATGTCTPSGCVYASSEMPCPTGTQCVGGMCQCVSSCPPASSVMCGVTIPNTCPGMSCGTGTSCALGEDCTRGRCVPRRVCSPGETRCSGSGMETCNATGTAWGSLTPCPCGCSGTTCASRTCTPDTRRCGSSTRVEVCSSSGCGWTTETRCATGEECVSGSCRPVAPTCTYSSHTNGDFCGPDGGDCGIASGSTRCFQGAAFCASQLAPPATCFSAIDYTWRSHSIEFVPGTGCRQVRGRFDGNFIRTCGTYPEEIGYTIAGSGCGGPNITCASSTARYSPSTGTLVADCTVDLTSRQSRADVFFWVTIGGRRYLRRTPFQVTCRE